MKKVIFISSAGGHLNELLKLSPLFEKYNSTLIVEKNETTRHLQTTIPVKYLAFGTRKHLFRYLFIFGYNILKSLYLFLVLQPDCIVTTGAHTAVPLVYIAHFFKRKILFIESVARVHSKSLAGKLMEKKVDRLFVQWEEMQEVYKNAEYHGTLL